MTTQRFAAWVEPFAAKYRDSQAETVRLARSVSAVDLKKPAGDEGWSVRDELVHIAASASDFVRTLGAIVRGETVDTSIFADIDARNARNLATHEDRLMSDIANDLESEAQALAVVLAQLTDADASRQPAGMPFALNQLLEGYAMHDPYHLAQIRGALGR